MLLWIFISVLLKPKALESIVRLAVRFFKKWKYQDIFHEIWNKTKLTHDEFRHPAALRWAGLTRMEGRDKRGGQSWNHIAFCANQKSGVRSNNGVFSLFPGSFQNSLPNLSPSTLPTPERTSRDGSGKALRYGFVFPRFALEWRTG